jgi:Zn-dependent protease/CBS domain-containing protein
MNWSFSIGRILGSEIRVHITFFLLLAWIAISYYRVSGYDAAVNAVAFILSIFLCVIAHEFGHILTARRFGIRTPEIILLPIGGVAKLERMPEKPEQEILVALAGPAVNFVIAAMLILFFGAHFDFTALESVENPKVDFFTKLAMVNVFLAVFNLLPAFPMDGGRVLRAVLAFRYSRLKATNIAASIGQGLAFALGFLGLLGNPILIFIAIFIYLAAASETQSETFDALTKHHNANDTMISNFLSLTPDDTIGDAADALLRTTQHEFPVIDGAGRLLGILTRTKMIECLAKDGTTKKVVEAMDRDIPIVSSGANLADVMKPLRNRQNAAVGVADHTGKLLGYVTLENVAEMVMVESALGQSNRNTAKI